MGVSSGKSSAQSQAGEAVEPFIESSIQPGFDPLKNQLFDQITEAFRTGGVGAQIPLIQQALSQSRSALSSGLQGTSDELARVGQAGTPFGQRQLGEQRRAGLQQIAGIPTQFAQQLTAQAPPLVQGLLTAMLGALAAGRESKSKSRSFGIAGL